MADLLNLFEITVSEYAADPGFGFEASSIKVKCVKSARPGSRVSLEGTAV